MPIIPSRCLVVASTRYSTSSATYVTQACRIAGCPSCTTYMPTKSHASSPSSVNLRQAQRAWSSQSPRRNASKSLGCCQTSGWSKRSSSDRYVHRMSQSTTSCMVVTATALSRARYQSNDRVDPLPSALGLTPGFQAVGHGSSAYRTSRRTGHNRRWRIRSKRVSPGTDCANRRRHGGNDGPVIGTWSRAAYCCSACFSACTSAPALQRNRSNVRPGSG